MTEEKLSDLGSLILRVGLGIVFIAHGSLKVFVFGLPRAVEVFAGHGVPGWSAYPVAAIELIGGTMLILGLGTRLVTPLLFCIAFVAGAVHFENGWNYTSPPDGGWEYGIFLAVATAAVALHGPGAYTLPSLFRK
ncbi:MAG: DoxX family protein [Gammaproteobacteria bacterium]|nr:DoxX family protein [Gammaproteobacteria bacterium]